MQAEDSPAATSRLKRLSDRVSDLFSDPFAPIVVLCLILVFSLYARVLDLGQPCTSPCHKPTSHTLVFDETYYINAARVIDHINPPKGSPYHGAPLGKDPNAEHPQLAKLIMAGGIKLFGDNPRGWRMGSVLFALIAMVALYALVRAAGGSEWLAVGATAVMALDNLLLVHGRIGTLDIYALAMMLIAMTLYLRRWPLLGGIALGVGACMKEVALYLLLVIALLELFRVVRARVRDGSSAGWRRLAARPLVIFVLSGVVSFLGLLWILDILVPAWDPVTRVTYSGNPFSHLWHIFHYALKLKNTANSHGIASSPWQWLLGEKAIDYAMVVVNKFHYGHLLGTRKTAYFRGEINPFIIFLAIPALFAAAAAAWRQRDPLATVGVCWCVGTFLPFVVESDISGRITYLYYMVIVMPGIYLVLCRMFSRLGWAAILGWGIMLSYSFIELYPIRTLL